MVRFWQVGDRSPVSYPDTEAYLEISRLPLASVDRWAGGRTPLVPVLLDLVGESGRTFMYLQIVLAALAWGLLAGEVGRAMATAGRRWVMAALVLAFSLTDPVTLWDQLVLTESLTMTLLAAMITLVLAFGRTGHAAYLVATIPTAIVWAMGRDTVAVVLLTGAALILVFWLFGDRRRTVVPVVLVALVGIAIVSVVGAGVGERDRSPMANVFAVRVMPYPERIDWFADQGMPRAEYFLERSANVVPPEDGQAPLVGISRTDPAMEPWWDWLESEGKPTFVRFVLAHPTYLLGEPRKVPERAFHSEGGNAGSNFQPKDHRSVPLVTRGLWWSTPVMMGALALALATVAWVTWGRPRHRLLTVAALLAVTGFFYGLVAWHSDGLEAARHVFVGGMMMRLAVLFAVAGAVALAPPVDRTWWSAKAKAVRSRRLSTTNALGRPGGR